MNRYRFLSFCAMLCAMALALTVASPASAGHTLNGLGHHWNKDGASRVSLYFDDNTDADWPIGSNITRWNEGYNRGADIYGYYRTSCSGATCIGVDEYTDGNPGDAAACIGDRGCFMYSFSGTHISGGTGRVRLNDTGRGDATQRNTTVCHELAHAYGLGHRTSTSSCTFEVVPYNAGATDHDYDELEDIYSHTN